MRKNCLLMCFVFLFLFLFPLLANAQFETINDVRYFYSKSKSAYEVVKIPSNQSPDFSGYSGDITVLNYINGKKVTTIDKRAFYWSDITSIKLPLSLTTIGEEAFAGNREITSIEIPQNVEYIHKEAFRYCENLKDIYCYAKCPILGKDVFGKVKGFTLHVPEDYISYYKNADQWKKAKKIIAITIESRAIEAEKAERIELEKLQKAEEQKKAEEAKRAAEEARLRAEAEAKQKAETEARLKAEAEAKKKEEEEFQSMLVNSPFKNSKYTDENNWQLIYPNGNIVESKNHVIEFIIKDHKYHFAVRGLEPNKMGIKDVMCGKQKLPILSPALRIQIYNAENSFERADKMDYKEIDRTVAQLIPMFVWDKETEYIFYAHNEFSTLDFGTYKNGKYYSKKAAEEAAEMAERNKFKSKYGFDPAIAKIGLKVGRTATALDAWNEWLKKNGYVTYSFKLSQDHGTSKCYRFYYNGDQKGFFWIKNGKITSVSWF